MSTFEGGCLCGAVRIKSSGEVKAKALCHCLDCRKISGAAFSANLIVAEDGFSVTKGTPKSFPKTADSGKIITSFFCGDCATTLWRETESLTGTKIIKAGVLDGDASLEGAKPLFETFVAKRVSWLPAVTGAEQHQLGA